MRNSAISIATFITIVSALRTSVAHISTTNSPIRTEYSNRPPRRLVVHHVPLRLTTTRCALAIDNVLIRTTLGQNISSHHALLSSDDVDLNAPVILLCCGLDCDPLCLSCSVSSSLSTSSRRGFSFG